MSDFTFVFRAFKASDNVEACRKYVQGHMRVLNCFGIAMITSAKAAWVTDPDTYVVSVESEDGEKIYGGGRIQIGGGNLKLPIETAVTDKDPSIHAVIREYAKKGTGEICGLWNSREMAVYGIGSLYLGRALLAITNQLKLNSLFALCAPATVRNSGNVGYETATFLGNNGLFYYPKDHLIATAMVIDDLHNLPAADPMERKQIQALRNNPVQQTFESGPRGHILDIRYELEIPDLAPVSCFA